VKTEYNCSTCRSWICTYRKKTHFVFSNATLFVITSSSMFIVIHTVTGHRSFHTATLPYIIESLDFKNESCGLSNISTYKSKYDSTSCYLPWTFDSTITIYVNCDSWNECSSDGHRSFHTATLPYIIESLDFKNESCGLSNSVIYRGIYPSLRKRRILRK
jgi:hypothetical protein